MPRWKCSIGSRDRNNLIFNKAGRLCNRPLKMSNLNFFICVLSMCCMLAHCDEELWKKDMTDEIYIETSHEGFEYVNLTCSKDKVCCHLSLFAWIVTLDSQSYYNIIEGAFPIFSEVILLLPLAYAAQKKINCFICEVNRICNFKTIDVTGGTDNCH